MIYSKFSVETVISTCNYLNSYSFHLSDENIYLFIVILM